MFTRVTVMYSLKLHLYATIEADVGAERASVGFVRLHVYLCA